MVPTPWPSTGALNRLVTKSSGYFIYATTIIKFIDDKNYRPTERLERIENLDGTEFDSPFGALDQLYTQILRDVPLRLDLLRILRVIVHYRFSLQHIEQLLKLKPGDVRLILRHLNSILAVPSSPDSRVNSHHASFYDFLRDSTRSGIFYVDDLHGRMDLARSFLKSLSYTHDDPALNRAGHIGWCVSIVI
ncbi:hypothetical protein GGX14DRAFT_381575 [Mycena pura]|uniref:Uncharacterized protein n=1 Tax=Mycena pura TaxID=153505 RepID=A0AAD6Y257_9AGAR|nr:hypothetical protein GGX14DRAFT_381575 [Mycena pura]